ncbi:MAG: cytochrome c oxidase assembly protein [Rhodospirillales bacterium]|nr:cytochrome c oxidase assembly protein [Rhodospirillales bacterium]
MSRRDQKNRKFALMLTTLVAGMVGVSFASVPLYQLFCKVTGYGGTLNTENVVAPADVSERTINVRFDSNISPDLSWRFVPLQRQVTVKLGEQTLAFFEAENTGVTAQTGQATFNVTPFKAAPYFSKIECFCFTEQTLAGGQTVPMPVQFFVDPEIFEDPATKDIGTITLSYTFYPAENDEDDRSKVKVSARVQASHKG